MVYEISKEFSFCYGHRVYSQKLNEEYCAKGDTLCKCRHLHGHEGLVRVHIESNNVDSRGMIVDFKELGWLKDFIDTVIDHKFIIDKNDPMFTSLVENIHNAPTCLEVVWVDDTKTMKVGEKVVLDNIQNNTPEYEVLEGYFIVDFVPTSENLVKWMYKIVEHKMEKIGAKVSFVEWHETPKTCARYAE